MIVKLRWGRQTTVFIASRPDMTFENVGQLVLSPDEYKQVVAALWSRFTVIEETESGEADESRG